MVQWSATWCVHDGLKSQYFSFWFLCVTAIESLFVAVTDIYVSQTVRRKVIKKSGYDRFQTKHECYGSFFLRLAPIPCRCSSITANVNGYKLTAIGTYRLSPLCRIELYRYEFLLLLTLKTRNSLDCYCKELDTVLEIILASGSLYETTKNHCLVVQSNLLSDSSEHTCERRNCVYVLWQFYRPPFHRITNTSERISCRVTFLVSQNCSSRRVSSTVPRQRDIKQSTTFPAESATTKPAA